KPLTAAVVLFLLSTPARPAPPVTALALSPDGQAVLVGSQSGIEIRSATTLEKTGTLPTEIPNVHDLAFSPDGKTLAVAGRVPGKRGLVELYSWPEGKRLRSAAPHRDSVYKLAWAVDGKTLFTAGGDSLVGEHDVGTLKTARTFGGHSKGVLAVAVL